MKSNKLFFGALTLLAFTACSDDKIADEPISGDDTFAYINVNLLSPGAGSRATTDNDFDLGTDTENKIENIVMIFYGSQGNYLSSASMSKGEITLEDATNNEEKNVELIKTAKVKVSLSGGTIPSYVMVFANPVNAGDINWGLSAIKNKTRNTYIGSNSNFAMNNSVYFKNGVLQRAVSVSKANFYQTEAEETSASTVDVYIERLAAKVKLYGKSESKVLGTQSGTLDNKTLNFVVDGWGLNATAKKCYLSKYFDLESFTDGYTTLNDELNKKFADWNESDKSRSYWAISPDYFKPVNNIVNNKYNYPYVSDQAPVSEGETKDNILNYYSFKDFAAGGSQNVAVGSSTYTLENTRHSDFYNGNDYKNSALISAVVVGHYTVNNEAKDFYVQGSKIYLEADYLTAMAEAANVIVKSDGSKLTKDDNLSTIFEIFHPTTPNMGDATKGVEENRVTVRIKNSKTGNEYLPDYSSLSNYKFKDGAADAEEISATNIDKINQLLYNHCGLSSMYKEGKAYFNIPIRHLADEPKEKEAWGAGSYGVVRNHLYNIEVKGFAELKFATLGEGVRDPEDPIVPPTDPDDKYGIKANIKVHSWRLVKQSVTLGGE